MELQVKREFKQEEGKRPPGAEMDAALVRDPDLAATLRMLEPPAGLLSWSEVERIVADAPPVRVSWADRLGLGAFATAGWRQLRYAVAVLLLLGVGTGVLAIVPAQSDQVGTLVLTRLPVAWQVGGVAFSEVEREAQSRFAALGIPQSSLYLKVGPRDGLDDLGFALVGVDKAQAERFFGVLAKEYPALAAFPAEYVPIDSGRFGSRLNELFVTLLHRSEAGPLDKDALKLHVLKALREAGFRDIRITVRLAPDGTTVVDVDARMSFSVKGRTQEDLQAAGVDEKLLGPEAYEQLLGELGLK